MAFVSMKQKTTSLAAYENARKHSAASSSARCAASDSTPAASKGRHFKTSLIERRTPCPPRATDFIVVDFKEVDYKSKIIFSRWEEEVGEVRQQHGVSPDQTFRTRCPFIDLSTVEESGNITNNLDEAQREQLDDARGRLSCASIHSRS
ncbi:hypothetical protein Plhal304r1_c014g0053031 [Plasmopara halstedii]